MNARYLDQLALLLLGIALTACSTGVAGNDTPLRMPYEEARTTGYAFQCNFTLKGLFGESDQYHSQILGDDFWVAQISDTNGPGALTPDELLRCARVDGTGYAWISGALSEPEGYPRIPYRFDMERVIAAYRAVAGEDVIQTPYFFVMPRSDTPCSPIQAVDMHLPPAAASFTDMTDEILDSIQTMRLRPGG